MNGPVRTCVGCREAKPKDEMIRVCCYEGKLSVDPTGRAKGRGVYVCRDPECLKKVIKKQGFKRGFRMNFTDDALNKVYEELEALIGDNDAE